MTPQERKVFEMALKALRKARRKVLTTEECHSVIMSIKEALAQQDCPFCAPQPQRTWVGLTDDEIALINADYPHPQGFAKAIQAILKEKNND